jgi:pimeloyl-ACP methyl ester carboxylesterase
VALPFPHVDGVTHHYADAGGLRMHYAQAGAGEPLVLLHGWPQHWYQWRHQIPELSKHFRVICPDLRGFGWSDAPPSGYDKETLAEDVVKLLDRLDITEPVELAGHDWGGWCGFLIALKHPERVERFLALNIPPPWGKTDLRTIGASWRFWYMGVLASPLGSVVVRRLPGLIERLIQRPSVHKDAWTEYDLRQYSEPLREPARARATVQLYRTFLLREFPKVAAGRYEKYRLTMPARLVFGTRDFAISTAFLRGYEPYVDDFEIEYVEDSGHFIGEEKGELVTERALEFFGVREAAAQTAGRTSP